MNSPDGVIPAPELTPEMAPAGAARRRLGNRREHELVNFEHAGIAYTAGVGRFDDGGLAEVFLTTTKHGTGQRAGRSNLGLAFDAVRLPRGDITEGLNPER